MIGPGAAKPAKQPNALHSNASDDHGTPVAIVELVRATMAATGRGIELDPFSSAYWNHHTVKAQRFYDRAANGFKQPWAGTVLVNHPGSVSEEFTKADGTKSKRVIAETKDNTKNAWNKLSRHYFGGEVDSAVWVGFALGQVCTLQNQATHPLQFITTFLIERQCFLQPTRGLPTPGESPTHANFLTLLPTRRSPDLARRQVAAFVEGVRALDVGGAIVRPL